MDSLAQVLLIGPGSILTYKAQQYGSGRFDHHFIQPCHPRLCDGTSLSLVKHTQLLANQSLLIFENEMLKSVSRIVLAQR